MVVVVLDYESRAGSIAFGIYRDGLPFGQFHVGPCDCSPVGHKPQIVIAVLVDLSYFVMVYESVGETVVAYLAAVVDAYACLGAYPSAPGRVEIDFIDVSTEQAWVGVSVMSRFHTVAVAVYSAGSPDPHGAFIVGCDDKNVAVAQLFGSGKVDKWHVGRVEYIYTSAIGAHIVAAVGGIAHDGEYHAGAHIVGSGESRACPPWGIDIV